MPRLSRRLPAVWSRSAATEPSALSFIDPLHVARARGELGVGIGLPGLLASTAASRERWPDRRFRSWLLHVEIGAACSDPLAVDAVVDPRQHPTSLDALEIP